MGAHLRDQLDRAGIKVSRRCISTVMKRMGIEALYRKPGTSKKHPGHKAYPYLLRGVDDQPSPPSLGAGHYLYPDGQRCG